MAHGSLLLVKEFIFIDFFIFWNLVNIRLGQLERASTLSWFRNWRSSIHVSLRGWGNIQRFDRHSVFIRSSLWKDMKRANKKALSGEWRHPCNEVAIKLSLLFILRFVPWYFKRCLCTLYMEAVSSQNRRLLEPQFPGLSWSKSLFLPAVRNFLFAT